MSAARGRLTAVQNAVRHQADRAGWRWDRDGVHPVFAALAAEALAIIAEHGIEPTPHQARTMRWIADGEMETLADVVELIIAGREVMAA